MQDAEQKSSAWRYSETALCQEDTLNLFQELAEQKRKEREKDPAVKFFKRKYSLKVTKYPSPGNILHTGRQLPRSPGPGVLPLLPSQKFEPREENEKSFTSYVAKTPNMVPCGRQLPRTLTKGNVLREIQINVREDETVKRKKNSERDGSSSMICDAREGETTRSKISAGNVSRASNKMQNMANLSCQDGVATMQMDSICENIEVMSRPTVPNNRRISEMPVQGLNQMRISGIIRKMAGYECRNEDLEFLKHMQHLEKAKMLKKELLRLTKDFATANLEKELVFAKKEKIEGDIKNMKVSYERTVQLGRALLGRTQDPTGVCSLTPDDVLKQLSSETIQHVHQQTRLQLAEAEKELAKWQQDAANQTALDENQRRSLALKVGSAEQHVKEVQHRIQQLQEELITLKAQIKRVEENESELQVTVQMKRQQISDCLKNANRNIEMSEEEESDTIKRRLQRILHRKDNYLERERILQRLKETLK
ncbi:uncharacterized protein LOC143815175 [Ranitomeya variabilis]|uniref:uncharacterized protein LOC143815175 n=1 Tax=Ranitomeya variabilis TaxID=490064 RepID=UPI00405692C7